MAHLTTLQISLAGGASKMFRPRRRAVLRRRNRLRLAIMGFCALLAVPQGALSQQAADQSFLFSDEHCPFVVSFAAGMRPTTSSAPGATTTTVAGQGFRVSAACIATPTASVLEGAALSDRLAMLAAAIGVTGTTIKAPAPPAASCGLIEGEIAPSGVANKVRTEFCYGPNGYLIVETTTDGTPHADEIVASVLASIARRPNLSKIEGKFLTVEN